MKLNKTTLLVGGFIVFWVILISWGMFKTAFKLSGQKAPPSAVGAVRIKEQEIHLNETPAPKNTPLATQPESRYILVRTFKVKATDFQDVLPVMGTVKGKTEIELRFEINGVVKKIYFHEGEKIKKGDLVAQLDPKDTELKALYAKNKFGSAQAAYNSSKKKLEVHNSLFAAGAIIKSKLEEIELESESAKFQAETAKSEMELAENELKKASLYAAKDGVMGPREAEEGEFVTPQDKVGSLLEISEVFVEVGVVERDIEKIKAGQKAKVFVDSYPNNAFQGTVKYIFPVIEGKSRTLTVKINVANPDRLLLPGMFSRAEILIVELKDALIIPVTSLISTKSGAILLPCVPKQTLEKSEDETQTGVVRLRKVKLGYKTSDYAQITEGINKDDLVILESQGEGKLEDNTPVKIIGVEELTF